jgi:ribosomal protein S18
MQIRTDESKTSLRALMSIIPHKGNIPVLSDETTVTAFHNYIENYQKIKYHDFTGKSKKNWDRLVNSGKGFHNKRLA